MQCILQRTLMSAISAEPKRNQIKRVTGRVLAGLCLTVEADENGRPTECDCPSEVRGVCRKHYKQFLRDMNDEQPEDRIDFEKGAIEDGQILGSHTERSIRQRERSPFVRR